ncbi:hypothetical protein Gotri_019748 [Gossypium trilobum]|uniref:Uncharacterized protein n=1 Tax=Gossypium trilobum TaxID=34281 RepID=A0A7J9EDZ6_9ROSI|nr:hypothetical protein [Gossypium trilobum]
MIIVYPYLHNMYSKQKISMDISSLKKLERKLLESAMPYLWPQKPLKVCYAQLNIIENGKEYMRVRYGTCHNSSVA